MEQLSSYYKEHTKDKIWWKNTPESKGEWIFSFDKKRDFNMFADYPHNLTAEQKRIFDAENPYWAEFFAERV